MTTLTTVAEPPVIMRDDQGLADVVDLFAGPGGWDLAARMLGLVDPLGFEMDETACQTRCAARLRTVRCDVSQMVTLRRLLGLIGSPPCTMYSKSGWRVAAYLLSELCELIRDWFAGRDGAGRITAMIATLEEVHWRPLPVMTVTALAEARQTAAMSAALVAEPARFIRAGMPRWVALEQVPSVLPLWELYAAEMRALGYSVWTGVLDAASYGLGQDRKRAVLIASLDRLVSCPLPSHGPAGQMFVQRQRSMASVIGWGATHRPSPTVTAGGIKSGGAEPFGSGARKILAREMAAGRWIPNPRNPLLMRPSPEECARLQGFPEDYPFAGLDGRRSQQAGNAVPPPFGAAILAEATGLPRPPVEEP
jgi:DNA (cytosine-5)-methyltransferase 1